MTWGPTDLIGAVDSGTGAGGSATDGSSREISVVGIDFDCPSLVSSSTTWTSEALKHLQVYSRRAEIVQDVPIVLIHTHRYLPSACHQVDQFCLL